MTSENGIADTAPLIIADRYELRSMLGRGAMGTVYRVRDLERLAGAGLPEYALTLFRLRFLVAWKGDRERALRLFRELDAKGSRILASPEIHVMFECVGAREIIADARAVLDAAIENAKGLKRRHASAFQVRAEFYGFLGDAAETLASVEGASQAGLYDLAWLDGCPLLRVVRDDPRFVAVRASVAERVDQMLAAADSP